MVGNVDLPWRIPDGICLRRLSPSLSKIRLNIERWKWVEQGAAYV